MLIIPLNDHNDQVFDIPLSGQTVNLRMHWNKLQRVWMLTARVGLEYLVVERVVASLQRLIQDYRFLGDLMAVPLRDNKLDPGRWAWGRTHRLFFIENEAINKYQADAFYESIGVSTQAIDERAPIQLGNQAQGAAEPITPVRDRTAVGQDLTSSNVVIDNIAVQDDTDDIDALLDTEGQRSGTTTPFGFESDPEGAARVAAIESEFVPSREGIEIARREIMAEQQREQEPVITVIEPTGEISPTPGFSTPSNLPDRVFASRNTPIVDPGNSI